MRVQSSRFGEFEIEASRALKFTQNLLGFPESTTYVVVEVEDSPYIWLQSADEPDVAFLATSPFLFFPEYDLVLGDEEQSSLELEDPSQVEVLTLLTVHRSDRDDVEQITANLLGPIIINTESRQALQLVLDNPSYTTREPLVA